MRWGQRPLSLTLRVALLLAAVVVATFLAAGAYLYTTLAQHMVNRDNVELIDKVVQIRRIIAELPSPQAIVADRRPLMETLSGHNDFMLRVNGPDGTVLLQSSRTSRPLPRFDSVPARRALTLDDVHDWTPEAGVGRMVSAAGQMGGGQTVDITLARERSDRLKILRGTSSTCWWRCAAARCWPSCSATRSCATACASCAA